MFVKICGVTRTSDVEVAAESGADAVGIVFGPSVRQVDVPTARLLVAATPAGVTSVGVFGGVAVDAVAELATRSGVDAVQLHGGYTQADFRRLQRLARPLWRAASLAEQPDLRVGAYGEQLLLLDAPVAGAGLRWDLAALEHHRPVGRWLLAGGLTPSNVHDVAIRARPWGVDVSSGVEARRGRKDPELIREFVANARQVRHSTAGDCRQSPAPLSSTCIPPQPECPPQP